MSIPIHPRNEVVVRAQTDLSTAMVKILEERRLTHAEVTSILAHELLSWNTHAIGAERHPDDPDKRGGEA